jgi:hypothetical protein
MSGEDAPRPCLENLIVPEIKTNKQELFEQNKKERPHLAQLFPWTSHERAHKDTFGLKTFGF